MSFDLKAVSLSRSDNQSIEAVSIEILPKDIIRLICSYLNLRDVVRLASTKKHHFTFLTSDISLWRTFVQEHFPNSCTEVEGLESQAVYKRLAINNKTITENIRSKNYRFHSYPHHKVFPGKCSCLSKGSTVVVKNEGTITVLDFISGKDLKVLHYEDDGRSLDQFSLGKGKFAACFTSKEGSTIRIWDFKNGEKMRELYEEKEIHCLLFHANQLLYSVDKKIKSLDLESGKETILHQEDVLLKRNHSIKSFVAYKNKLIFKNTNKQLKILDLESKKILMSSDEIYKFSVYENSLIGVSDRWKSVKMWDLKSGQDLGIVCTYYKITSLLIHDHWLFLGISVPDDDKNLIKIFDLKCKKVLQTLKGINIPDSFLFRNNKLFAHDMLLQRLTSFPRVECNLLVWDFNNPTTWESWSESFYAGFKKMKSIYRIIKTIAIIFSRIITVYTLLEYLFKRLSKTR